MKKKYVLIIIAIASVAIIIKNFNAYSYLKSDDALEDILLFEQLYYKYQKVFLELPANNEIFMDFAMKNLPESNSVKSLERIRKYKLQFLDLDSTIVIFLNRSKNINAKNMVFNNGMNFLGFLFQRKSIILGRIEMLDFSCSHKNSFIFLLSNNKLISQNISSLNNDLKQITLKISNEVALKEKGYVCFRLRTHNKNWDIEIICDEKGVLREHPTILATYLNYFEDIETKELDYVLCGTFIWSKQKIPNQL